MHQKTKSKYIIFIYNYMLMNASIFVYFIEIIIACTINSLSNLNFHHDF